MRLSVLVFAIVALTGCKQGPNTAAARQAVVDRLNQMGMPAGTMDIAVTAFEVKGNEADATVSLTLKDGKGAPPMVMKYRMQQQGDKWVVVSRLGDDMNQHGGGVAPGGASPHGAGSGAMPSPDDLPPAGKKK